MKKHGHFNKRRKDREIEREKEREREVGINTDSILRRKISYLDG
jgi:hypothetical protein